MGQVTNHWSSQVQDSPVINLVSTHYERDNAGASNC